MTMIGKSVQRLEDEPLITGRGKFVANLSFPDELHMRVVRSPYAHATLRGVDALAALALSGVAAVWTFADVAHIPPIEFRPTKVQGLEPYRQTILANDRLRYVGEPVAVVFAESSYIAEDAADLVAIDATQLPAVLDARSSEIEPAILRKEYGDLDNAFAKADQTTHAGSCHRSPLGRAARVSRCHRPPGSRQRDSRVVRGDQAAARQPRRHRADAGT